MRANLFRYRKMQSGYSLIEIIASITVIGIGLPAVIFMYTTAFVVDADNSARSQGIYIANALMNEISQRRFMHSVAFPGNGPETGEVINASYDRRNFNDIDDYEHFSVNGGWDWVSPP